MSRLCQYRLKIEQSGAAVPGLTERVWLIFTPSSGDPMPSPVDTIDVPFGAFVGVDLPFRKGWKDRPLGTEEDSTLKLKIDLGQFAGSADIEAMRGYLLDPGTATTVQPGGVGSVRALTTYTLVEVYSDGGTGGTPNQLRFIGVQSPQQVKEFEISDTAEMTIEFMDVISWALEATTPADISAWASANGGLYADGPYTKAIVTNYLSGPAEYEHYVSAPDPGNPYDLTFYPLYFVYLALAGAVQAVARKVIRKSADFLVSPVGAYGAATPVDHWSMWETAYTAAGAHDPARSVGISARSVLGTIAFSSDPSIVIGGFFYAGPKAGTDTIGGWETARAFLRDTTTGTVSKVTARATNSPIDAAPQLVVLVQAVKGRTGPAATALDPAELQMPVKIRQGQGVIRGVSGAVPAARSNDESSVTSGAQEEPFSLPRTWHTLPTTWTEGRRQYSSGVNLGTIRTSEFNCLTLWVKTTRFAQPQYIRIHQHVTTTDGDGTVYADDGGAVAMPTPVTAGKDYLNNPGTGDNEFGVPLIEAYRRIQRESSVPQVAARALCGIFAAGTSEYEGKIDLVALQVDQVGNRVSDAAFADGSALVDGATYLGALPGEPIILGLDGDLMGSAKVRLGGLP